VTRNLRRWTTLICLAGFAFTQLALAAYACPLRAPAAADTIAAASAAGGLDHCPGHAKSPAPESGPLCEAHCEAQSGVPGGATPSVPPLVLAPFPVVLALDAHLVPVGQLSRIPPDANAVAPPVAQRFCRLLI
jgi:hypothetical protein